MGPEPRMPGHRRGMPAQSAGSKARKTKKRPKKRTFSGLGSAADKALRRVDHLLQAAGHLEVAEPIRRQPFEVVIFVIELRLAADPARGKRHDEVMPATAGSRQ